MQVGQAVCTPVVQAPLSYNPVQCLVRQTLPASTLASDVLAPPSSRTVGAPQSTTSTDASALPTVALTVQCTASTLKQEPVLGPGAVVTTVAPVATTVSNTTSATTGTATAS